MNFIKQIIKKKTPEFFAFLKFIRFLTNQDCYLKTTGFFNTYHKGYPCKIDGSPLPWMNYAVINFLDERLNKQLKLFEYGSGYSTLYFANLVDQVVSVEYSPDWYEYLKEKISNNVKLIYQQYHENGAYCNLVNQQHEAYDVIIIDGRDRVRSAINAIAALSEEGVIIFDDSQREKYFEGINFLLNKGFKKIDFEGIQPAGYHLQRTSIFYRSDNCLFI
jgi:hypothetical protein